MDGLTDREIYAWHFRKYDREADAADWQAAAAEAEAEKTLDQRRAEYVAMCRSFGCPEEAAGAEWQKWLADQGA